MLTKRTVVLLFVWSVGVVLADAGPLYFRAIVCGTGLPGDPPCTVTAAPPRMPTAEEAAGLTYAAFAAYYGEGWLMSPAAEWTITDSNSAGTIIGQFTNEDFSAHTAFLYSNGAVVCCTLDDAWLTDINEAGMVLGGSDFAWFVQVDAVHSMAQNWWQPYGFNGTVVWVDPRLLPVAESGWWYAHYSAIDDAGRVAGSAWDLPFSFEFHPVPEPRGVALALLGVGMIAARQRSRR